MSFSFTRKEKVVFWKILSEIGFDDHIENNDIMDWMIEVGGKFVAMQLLDKAILMRNLNVVKYLVIEQGHQYDYQNVQRAVDKGFIEMIELLKNNLVKCSPRSLKHITRHYHW